MQQLPASQERDAFLDHMSKLLRDRSGPMTVTRGRATKGRLIMAPHVWRQHVESLVQNIIAPDSLCWMDDDDGTSVTNICLRSLQEIETRFKQRVPFF